jgi:hypothetical protein
MYVMKGCDVAPDCFSACKGLIGNGPRGWGCEPRRGWADFVTGAKCVAVQILRALSRVVALVALVPPP